MVIRLLFEQQAKNKQKNVIIIFLWKGREKRSERNGSVRSKWVTVKIESVQLIFSVLSLDDLAIVLFLRKFAFACSILSPTIASELSFRDSRFKKQPFYFGFKLNML